MKHRLSSVAYPHSNGRVELAVKTGSGIVNGNTHYQGSLDNDKVARAILQHHKIHIKGISLSLAQFLLHDFLPSQPILYKWHPEGITAAWSSM